MMYGEKNINSDCAEKLTQLGSIPGPSIDQEAAVTTKLLDWTYVVPKISHIADSLEKLIRFCFLSFKWASQGLIPV